MYKINRHWRKKRSSIETVNSIQNPQIRIRKKEEKTPRNCLQKEAEERHWRRRHCRWKKRNRKGDKAKGGREKRSWEQRSETSSSRRDHRPAVVAASPWREPFLFRFQLSIRLFNFLLPFRFFFFFLFFGVPSSILWLSWDLRVSSQKDKRRDGKKLNHERLLVGAHRFIRV